MSLDSFGERRIHRSILMFGRACEQAVAAYFQRQDAAAVHYREMAALREADLQLEALAIRRKIETALPNGSFSALRRSSEPNTIECSHHHSLHTKRENGHWPFAIRPSLQVPTPSENHKAHCF